MGKLYLSSSTRVRNLNSITDFRGTELHALRRGDMKRLIFAWLALAASTCMCSAAEFYVIQDATTKQCRVVDQKPSDAPILVIGSGNQVYTTKDEADAAMRSARAFFDKVRRNPSLRDKLCIQL